MIKFFIGIWQLLTKHVFSSFSAPASKPSPANAWPNAGIPRSEAAPAKSTAELIQAFAGDGYEVVQEVAFQGKRGLKAQSRTAVNYETREKKTVYYVEGSHYQMGYLLGQLAAAKVEAMTARFLDSIIPSFFNSSVAQPKHEWLWKLAIDLLEDLDKKMRAVVPPPLLEEMQGLVDGCHAANAKTTVNFEKIFALNIGVDFLLSIVYNVEGLWKKIPGIQPQHVKAPIFCNGFAVFGKATVEGKHYFGRDFMFPTADVFQDTATMVIYNPDRPAGEGTWLPLVAVTAPGFVGAVTSMNAAGVGIGVDMAPSGNINRAHPGLNSLLLVRYASHRGDSAEAALQTMIEAPRGVSWIYLIADGANDRAAVVEAGAATPQLTVLDFPPTALKQSGLLPDQNFLNQYETQKPQNGLMVRWNDYQYPAAFFQFNPALFKHYNKPYDPAVFGEDGFINPMNSGTNCPQAYYFAPQRESKPDIVLATNMFVTPSMRLCGMDPWTVEVAGSHFNNLQWRYDTLNKLILDNYGRIDAAQAQTIIDFLAPYGNFPDYYKNNLRSADGKTVQINGATSLCNLTDKTITSHYGYFADEWITLRLPSYIDAALET